MAIIAYYLDRLKADAGPDNQPQVQVISHDDVRSILDPLIAQNRQNGNFFCGADLEGAVQSTYFRCLREAVSGVSRSEGYAKVVVQLTKLALDRSLNIAPRSVRADAMEQFREDQARYCGGSVRSWTS